MIGAIGVELERTRLLPLVDHPDPEVVVAACRAAESAGASVVEVGLRHPSSVQALSLAASAVSIPVGAGTVIDPDQVRDALDAGARFLVSPGFDPTLAEAIERAHAAWLPGAATPTEALAARRAGASHIKVFPAMSLGGAAHLRALAATVTGVRFVPTGGITAADVPDLLDIGAVAAVGGSWMFQWSGSSDGLGESIERAVAAALALTRPQ